MFCDELLDVFEMFQYQLGLFKTKLKWKLNLRGLPDNQHGVPPVIAFQDFCHKHFLLYEMSFIKLEAEV